MDLDAHLLLELLRAHCALPGLIFSEPPTPVSGGFDTRIFAFRLDGAPAAFSGPLILRLLPPHHDPARVLRERAIQNAVAAQGYPTPRVLLASAEVAPLGGAWLIMERVPGVPLLRAQLLTVSRVLADLQRQLHALDPDALLHTFREEGQDPGTISVDGLLSQLRARAGKGSLSGLERALAWLAERRPPDRRRVICHGDFHPLNILVQDGAVTGVLDWPNTIIADSEYDVAATRVILSLTPVAVSTGSAPLRWLVIALRPLMVARYGWAYRRSGALDETALAYYEALACMRGIVRAAESRLRPIADPPNPLDASSFAEALAAHFARITGISPTLPPAGGGAA